MNAPVRSSIVVDETAALSPLHSMLASIRRAGPEDVAFTNAVLNHEAVLPTIKAHLTPPLDLAGVLSNPACAVLLGEHGLMFFMPVEGTNIFSAHTAVLPSGRGPWALLFVRACIHWIFTVSGAIEISTRCPHIENHKATTAMCVALGATFEGVIANGYPHNGGVVPADIYTLRLLDWIRTAPGLVQRGQWFHAKLDAEYARLGRVEPNHPDEEAHDRHVGACAEMIFAGNVGKGVGCYNRFARICDYAEIRVVTAAPLMIDIRDAYLMIRDRDFYVYALSDQQGKPRSH